MFIIRRAFPVLGELVVLFVNLEQPISSLSRALLSSQHTILKNLTNYA